MAEEFKIAWAVYAGGVVILLAAGWWFMRNWSWSWVRNLILLEAATLLLVPARGTAPDGPLTPVLPLFVYQTVFEEEGATPEVSASLVFAAAGAFAVMLIVGIMMLMVRRRKDRPMTESDQY
ncbi:hypothetical protein [Microbulbifer hydrolyticus]|uniref:MFS transporter n=1 Tax=Microbulbifer hydrolyticus TaxID=48074 RepID=A0A6P1TEB0_9GAMM|nr:hypothetical protein [Microbulbifer hydrolyticus]MBB5212339.1 hypothetical protein [Microbulbifer hydrolyticus]QHQ39983.1 hypothetical protein GTQ55_13980 [Microbulbifer hydrolyticus]